MVFALAGDSTITSERAIDLSVLNPDFCAGRAGGGLCVLFATSDEYPDELLSRHLPDDPFHFQHKQRSQNFRRVQAGAFDQLVHVTRLVGVEHGVERAFRSDQRSEEHTSELQSPCNLVCRLLLEKKKK